MNYYFLINERLKKICEVIEEKFLNSSKPTYFGHSLRAANYCYQMAKVEKIDFDIAVTSALIHDIGKTVNPGFKEHVECLEELGSKILLDCGYSEDEIQRIIEIAISHHPDTDKYLDDIYKQILFDADNLDCVGVFGILRWYNGVPVNLKYMIENAEMYLNYFKFENRENFFYTSFAQKNGENLRTEGLEYAKKIIGFCKLSIEQNESLYPISLKTEND
jgi:uncharacterized domain HDIG